MSVPLEEFFNAPIATWLNLRQSRGTAVDRRWVEGGRKEWSNVDWRVFVHEGDLSESDVDPLLSARIVFFEGAINPMQIVLTVIAGPHLGQAFAFDRHDHFLVGRAKQAHFRLPEKDPYFSRLQFMVEVNPPACRLVDMGSRNGTLVNGKRVPAHDLKHGDRIQAGETVLRVTIDRGESGDDVDTALRKDDVPTFIGIPEDSLPGPSAASTDLRASNAELMAGWQPPGFEIEELIGSGGMGVVYRARRLVDSQLVAIKAIKPAMAGSPTEFHRFLREIEVLGQLDHPHIVRLIEAGEAGGLLYFAMDYVEGLDAEVWLRKQSGPVPVATAIRLMLPVLKALDHAHQRGFVHRDVKPRNILLARDGKTLRVQLADFGLARMYQESKLSGLTLTGNILGTPKFMAPEQITDARQSLPASDQYSAAATLYRLLTGSFTHDFSANLQESLRQILLDPPVRLLERRADLPGELADVVERALAKEPGERFGSVGEFAEALRGIGG